MDFVKKVVLWGVVAAIIYILLSYHFIFTGWTVPKLLKKSSLTLNYTFFSLHGKTNNQIVAIDDLRDDGIADVLVDMGKMSKSQREMLLYKYDHVEEDDD